MRNWPKKLFYDVFARLRSEQSKSVVSVVNIFFYSFTSSHCFVRSVVRSLSFVCVFEIVVVDNICRCCCPVVLYGFMAIGFYFYKFMYRKFVVHIVVLVDTYIWMIRYWFFLFALYRSVSFSLFILPLLSFVLIECTIIQIAVFIVQIFCFHSIK